MQAGISGQVWNIEESAGLFNQKENPMARSEVVVYRDAGKWHFLILKLMDGTTSSTLVAYKSRTDTPRGFDTEEKARQAGSAQEFNLPSQ